MKWIFLSMKGNWFVFSGFKAILVAYILTVFKINLYCFFSFLNQAA